ncbi:MAG: hypothetical protein QW520_07000 [Methanomassiliicoccales archaeon]
MKMSKILLEEQRVVLNLDPGVCRFKTKIIIWSENGKIKCEINSGCKHVKDFGKEIETCEIIEALHMPYSENRVYLVGGRTLKHASCPIPMAVLKGFEVAAGLGLKRPVSLTFE